ncbi:LysE family translocator [Nitratireductor sp. CH_MIT9313-5]|jgi:threonine/homoserine/homoserine lactone efflux protein|uniref:LysE family translocator n=1 Tax=Nitratireductor sp. CH_MIT9313-5 TaxID=3107764 RepID=UPI00300AC086
MEWLSAIPLQSLLPFLLASLLIELTPGPNMAYLALVSASEGRRAGAATVAGVALGLAVIGIIAALGVAQLIQASPLLYEGLRWAGIAFLLYLAWDGWRMGTDIVKSGDKPDSQHFMRGFITNLLNPKAGAFYVTVLPSFVVPGLPASQQTIILTGAYVGVATAVHAAIVILAGSLEPILNNPRRELVARRVLSAMLAAVAIWFGWATGR